MLHLFVLSCLVLHCFCAVIGNSTATNIPKDYSSQGTSSMYHQIWSLLDIEETEHKSTGTNIVKTRFKRQQSSGAGKFTQAAKVPQIKLLRLFLTMFKNLWASSYTGGAHPFHHNVPKPIVQLYKQKIVEFFFPDVGDDAKKQK